MASQNALPDKWQVVRTAGGAKPTKSKKSTTNTHEKIFKPVPLAMNTYENLDIQHDSDSDNERYGIVTNGQGPKKQLAKGNKKSKKAPPSPPKPPSHIEIDFAKLAGSLATCRTKYPNDDVLFLKEVAEFVRYDSDFKGACKLGTVEEFGFPMKHLNIDQINEFKAIFGSISDENSYGVFIEYAIDELTKAFSHQDDLLSHRLVLQVISFLRPQSFTELSEKYAGVIKNSKNAPHRLLAIMTAFAQAGIGSLSAGLNVWFTVMLPTIQLPNMASMTLTFGEKLLGAYNVLNDIHLPPSSAPQTLQPAFDLLMNALQTCQPYNPPPNSELFAMDIGVSPQHFFRLFDMIYPVNIKTGKMANPAFMNRLSPGQKRQLAALCFRVKVMLMKYGSDCNAATMFPSFLLRLHENLPPTVKKELLANLLVCLHCDQPGSSQAWLGTTNRLPENSMYLHASVVEHITAFFGDFVPDVPKLQRTMKQVEKAASSRGCGSNSDDRSMGRSICGAFFRGVFGVVRTLFFLITLAVVADLLLANFQADAMTTTKLMKEYDVYRPMMYKWNQASAEWKKFVKKIYPYCANLYESVTPYAIKTSKVFMSYYTPASKAAKPYINTAWVHASNFHEYTSAYAAKGNMWLIDNGIDVKGSANWVVQNGLPFVAKQMYDGSVVVVNFYETNVMPAVKQGTEWMYTTALPWVQQQVDWVGKSIKSTAAQYGYKF